MYIIWDWNGTLIDDRQAALDVLNMQLVLAELPEIDLACYLDKFHFPIDSFYEEIGFDFSKRSFNSIAQFYADNYRKLSSECALSRNSLEAISELHKTNNKQLIISASDLDSLHMNFDRLPIKEAITDIIALEDIYQKSKESLFVSWRDKNNIEVNDVLMIGDTNHDFEIANKYGCNIVLYTGGHQSRSSLEKCGAPIIDDLIQVVDIAYELSNKK